MRERLEIEVLESSSQDKGTLSSDQVVQAVLARRDEEAMMYRTARVDQVVITLEGMQASAKKARLPSARMKLGMHSWLGNREC